MSKQEEITAWELLRQTSKAIDEIVVSTATNKPDEETTERIQQALIVAMGAVSIFSQHLAENDIHEVVGSKVSNREGK